MRSFPLAGAATAPLRTPYMAPLRDHCNRESATLARCSPSEKAACNPKPFERASVRAMCVAAKFGFCGQAAKKCVPGVTPPALRATSPWKGRQEECLRLLSIAAGKHLDGASETRCQKSRFPPYKRAGAMRQPNRLYNSYFFLPWFATASILAFSASWSPR